MPGLEMDLNEEAHESANFYPIDWDDIVEYDGPAHQLDYDFVWDDGSQDGVQGDGTDGVHGDGTDGEQADGSDGVQADGSDGVQADGSDGVQGDGLKKRKHYPNDLKIAIYLDLLAKTDPPVLRRGVTKSVSEKFGVPLRVVQAIWKNGQDGGIERIVNKYSKNCGRKRVQVDLEAIKNIPLKQRSTFQDLANALGVKKSTLYNRFKEGYFRRHTNDLKFSLTDPNKIARVKYCLSMMDALSLSFNPMYNIVYIDEKWFYRTRKNQKYYLANDEERPQRTVKSKNFIEKVMFLAVVTRPRYDANGNCTFDGKIGIFPFVTVEPAKRKSPNRERGKPFINLFQCLHNFVLLRNTSLFTFAGELVTKAMTSVTKDVSRDFLINKVLPALKAKWPAEERGMPIFIQQDNAHTHIAVDDPAFVQAAQADGWDIRLTCQPPNSPELNVLDLGFFAAIQALFEKGTPNNITEILQKVDEAYQNYPVDRSNRIFLTQQCCMMEIMKHNGGQHYNVPHMKKKTLERQGRLPITLKCPLQLRNQAMQFIAT
ncbi:unnamed protein product [Urochloa decumbens]|uniref:DUF7769 domain-containing protein n=1 Tax=Urochloa decumbens TaxID=240449 RepID=A0ABC9GTT9_9POAL